MPRGYHAASPFRIAPCPRGGFHRTLAPMRRFDVVILGGAFSGASAAILLRREQQDLSVLIVERAPAFDAKVGEATTEMSAMFLTRRLAMWHHLEVEQLPKEGLRYWFSNEHVRGKGTPPRRGGFFGARCRPSSSAATRSTSISSPPPWPRARRCSVRRVWPRWPWATSTLASPSSRTASRKRSRAAGCSMPRDARPSSASASG